MSLHRIEIRCVVENERSRRVAQGLGYTLEGILAEAYYLHGNFRDLALYAMTASRWHEASQPREPGTQVMK
jgi:RimJ/RimL family protein N-acetyltransferase